MMTISPQVLTTVLCFGAMVLVMGLALWAMLGNHNTAAPNHDYQRDQSRLSLRETVALEEEKDRDATYRRPRR
jgi:hypothetical protein